MGLKRLDGIGAILLSLALLLPASSALGQVLNRNFTIRDQREADTTGTANHSGASNSATGQTICRNSPSTVTVSGASNHPESVKLGKASTKLRQDDPGNRPTIRVIGAGALVFNVVVTCERAGIASAVSTRLSPSSGRFQVRARNCTGLTTAQADHLRNTCEADEANRTIKLKMDENTIRQLKIQAKGSAT